MADHNGLGFIEILLGVVGLMVGGTSYTIEFTAGDGRVVRFRHRLGWLGAERLVTVWHPTCGATRHCAPLRSDVIYDIPEALHKAGRL